MEPEIDFIIAKGELQRKSFMVVDDSVWGVIEDEDATLSVQAPGRTNYIDFEFEKYSATVINAIDLGFQSSTIDDNNLMDLPDGVYHVKLTGTPSSYFKEKVVLRTDIVKYNLLRILASTMSNCNDVSNYNQNQFMKVWFLIMAAEAAVLLGDWCKADLLYNQAVKQLENLNCKDVLRT